MIASRSERRVQAGQHGLGDGELVGELHVRGHEHDRMEGDLADRQPLVRFVLGLQHQLDLFDRLGDARLVNPGSHADPRGGQAAHAEVERDGKRTTITLASPEGETLRGETFAGD